MKRFEVVANKDGEYNILISATDDKDHAEKARDWAKAQGFESIRISDAQNLERPDFIGAVLVR